MNPDPVAAQEPPRTTPEQAGTPLKITVATVTYNAAAQIERTITSVEQQDYPYVEHIIVDGNSQDGTLTHVQHYLERNSHAEHRHEIVCRSEPDEGLYDAMNKALRLATGQYILFLNAGDTLHSDHTLSVIADAALAVAGGDEERLPAVVYGDTDLTDAEGKFLRHRRLAPPEHLTWKSFRSGMLVCHQSFVARTDIAQQETYDDERYRYSADFDWCIRVMKSGQQRGLALTHAHSVLAHFLDTADGTTNAHHKASLRERYNIMCRHYGFIVANFMHAWFILRAFLKK